MDLEAQLNCNVFVDSLPIEEEIRGTMILRAIVNKVFVWGSATQ
jgi:hypothetical protein